MDFRKGMTARSEFKLQLAFSEIAASSFKLLRRKTAT
jgi:hypothetical protein